MRGLNCCGEVPITFVPGKKLKGMKRQTMWEVLANGAPVARRENPQFPVTDNTRGLSLVWQAEKLNLLLEQLKKT